MSPMQSKFYGSEVYTSLRKWMMYKNASYASWQEDRTQNCKVCVCVGPEGVAEEEDKARGKHGHGNPFYKCPRL